MSVVTTYISVNSILFVLGLAVLVKGSDWFIDGASFIAKRMNVPDVIIGLTLVSIGTSLPELAANLYSAATGYPEVAMGVIPGSNVANILLVLGVSVVCMKQVPVNRILFNRDTMVMTVVFLAFTVMCYFFQISGEGGAGLNRIESIILLLIFILYMVVLLKRKDVIEEEIKAEAGRKEEKQKRLVRNLPLAVLFVIIGGVMVVGGAQFMVDNVVWIAKEKLHVSLPIINATIVAFGTSVPELAVTLAGIVKKKSDIALGNIIGSSIFNLIFVMGVTGLVAEIPVGADTAQIILPYMVAAGAVLVIFMRSSWALVRWEGVLMLIGYFSYICVNVYRVLTQQT